MNKQITDTFKLLKDSRDLFAELQESVSKNIEILDKTIATGIAEKLVIKPEKPGIEQLFIVGSTWKNLIGKTVYTIVDASGNKVQWDNDSYCYHKEVSINNILIDTGKISISDQLPPEGVPFIGHWNSDCFNDFMIENGKWYIRPSGRSIMEKRAYTVEELDAPDDITHWQISGPLAITAMKLLGGNE